MSIGAAMYLNNLKLNTSNFFLFVLRFGAIFHQAAVWTMSPFIVQILLKYLKKETMKKEEDLLQKCQRCVQLFESLSLGFAKFFIVYFTLIQCYSIFVTFQFIQTLPIIITFTLQGFLFLIGFVTGLGKPSIKKDPKSCIF